MTSRDKIGLVVLVVLFVVLIVGLIFTFKPPEGPAKDYKDSYFVQQRIRNLEKSQ